MPGSDRELLFENLTGVPNIVPIIDVGEDDDSWLIAMPRAERSLRAEIQAVAGRLGFEHAVPILIDVAKALAGIDGRVVHRDLKPENVLPLDGSWSLADFGIAKYAEAATATETWKGSFSLGYAAPERWQYDSATGATDIYSLGVMGYELVMGALPFNGPAVDDFRNQHVNEPAPAASGVRPALASLIAECMIKAPGSRPTPSQVLVRLELVLTPSSPGVARLQAANQAVQALNVEELARAAATVSESERRRQLFAAATRSLEVVSGQLRQTVEENAPAAALPVNGSPFEEWALQLGDAVLGMDTPTLSDPGSWGAWPPKFDVIAFAEVGIVIPEDRHGYRGRGHSLYYCDAQADGVYRWYETAFMASPLLSQRTAIDPIPFPPGENAGKALSRTIAEWQVAWPFMPLDQGDEAGFIDRWLDWFGLAASGQLRHPSSMPERPPQGSYRD